MSARRRRGAARALRAASAAVFLGLVPAAEACEAALVLAIDVSGSVDPNEYAVQMGGLAAALGDPTVADALVGAQALVLVAQWTGASRQRVVVPWTEVTGHADVAALAGAVEAAPRVWRHFSTGIGEALSFAAQRLDEAPRPCRRRVVDVSGDGRSNEGRHPGDARDALVAQGVTVNGLAIEGSEPELTAYYRSHVVGGPGAFVVTADGFEDYPRAIRLKLLDELTTPTAMNR